MFYVHRRLVLGRRNAHVFGVAPSFCSQFSAFSLGYRFHPTPPYSSSGPCEFPTIRFVTPLFFFLSPGTIYSCLDSCSHIA